MSRLTIFSQAEPGLLLHVALLGGGPEPDARDDVSLPAEPLQVSAIAASEGRAFPAHQHVPKGPCPETTITQETWIVISGQVEVSYYDIDGALLREVLLAAGDCSITYRGGHGYRILREARIYEVKSGPYFGRDADKVLLRGVG